MGFFTNLFKKNIVNPSLSEEVKQKTVYEKAAPADYINGYYSPDKNYYAQLFNGELSLIDCEKNTFIFKINGFNTSMYPFPKPNNNGYVELIDYPNKNELFSIYYLVSPFGEILVKQSVNANIYSTGLSDDYKYTCFQTLNNPKHEDGQTFFIIDIGEGKIANRWEPLTGVAESYKIDTQNQTIEFYYRDGNSFIYEFNGNFLDHDKWEQIQLSKVNGYDLYRKADDMISNLNLQEKSVIHDYYDSIKLLELAVEDNISPNYKAMSYKKLGEIYLIFGKKETALKYFKDALSFNDKIGVKRLVAKLEKELKIGGTKTK